MGTVGQAHSLSIGFLKKHGYLKDEFKYGGITWSRNEEYTGNINFWVSRRDMDIRLIYTVTSHSTGVVQHMDYKVPLLKTSCNYGGYRYWFQCTYCHRRVSVLYIKTYAKCRKCSRLTYASQKAGRLERSIGSKGYMYMLSEERDAIRTTHYAGKPTKRYLRYLKRSKKAEMAFARAMFFI